MTLTPTGALAEFVASVNDDAIPSSVRELATIAMTDGVGVLIAGARSPVGRAFGRYVARLGGAPEASVIPGRQRLPAEKAALANGVSGHALDFDDTTHPAHAHATTVLFPSAFATAQLADSSGRDLVTAYLIGFEVESALGRALNLSHYEAGWHATSTFGALGAAASAARLLRLPADRVAAALGIAASSASGLRGNFGTMTKPLHAGLAAEAGVRAAILAGYGWTADPDIIGVRNGFATALGGAGPVDLAALGTGLGERWTIAEPVGLALKRYPSCGGTHPALDAVFDLRPKIGPRAIMRVYVGTSRLSAAVLRGPNPRTSEAARFSLEYVVAAALVRGRLELGDLEPARLADPDVEAVESRVSTAVDERVADSREYAAIVSIDLEDGTTLEQRIDIAQGKNAQPLTTEARLDKFRGCVGDDADALLAAIERLDTEGGRTDLETSLERISTPRPESS